MAHYVYIKQRFILTSSVGVYKYSTFDNRTLRTHFTRALCGLFDVKVECLFRQRQQFLPSCDIDTSSSACS